MPYAPVSITGFNANPPADDGTHVTTNEISWAGILSKIGTPLQTALNSTQTAISTIITTLEGSLSAPTTTRSLFHQTAAPTGWTKDTSRNDKALRVVSGTVGADGGTTAFSTLFAARTIAQANLPNVDLVNGITASNNLDIANPATSYLRGGSVSGDAPAGTGGTANLSRGASQVTIGLTGAVTIGGHAYLNGNVTQTTMDFAVQRVDVIIAQKD